MSDATIGPIIVPIRRADSSSFQYEYVNICLRQENSIASALGIVDAAMCFQVRAPLFFEFHQSLFLKRQDLNRANASRET